MRAVRGENRGCERAAVSEKGGERRGAAGTPEAGGLVVRCGDDLRSVGRVRGAGDRLAVAGKEQNLRAVVYVPGGRRGGLRGCTTVPPVGRESARGPRRAMTGEHTELGAGIGIPDPCRLVPGGGRDARA